MTSTQLKCIRSNKASKQTNTKYLFNICDSHIIISTHIHHMNFFLNNYLKNDGFVKQPRTKKFKFCIRAFLKTVNGVSLQDITLPNAICSVDCDSE